MQRQTIDTYTYAELNEKAQEAVRIDYRDRFMPRDVHGAVAAVLERSEKVGILLGITFDRRLEGDQQVDRPAFWFHGFDGPTCGAAFDGEWERDKLDYVMVFKLFGDDAKLCNIAKDLRDAPKGANACAKSPRGGPTLDIDVAVGVEIDEAIDIERALREFAGWVYDELKNAYLAVSADEAIAGALIGRGAEYTVTGGTLA